MYGDGLYVLLPAGLGEVVHRGHDDGELGASGHFIEVLGEPWAANDFAPRTAGSLGGAVDDRAEAFAELLRLPMQTGG